MRRNTLGVEEFYSEILRGLLDILGEELLAAFVFGSTIYYGKGRDVDIVAVVSKDRNMKEKLALEYRIRRHLCRDYRICGADLHVMSIHEFRENLKPGTFLSGFALGYRVLLDRGNIEKEVLSFLKLLNGSDYVIYNRYGRWNLGRHAGITYRRRKRELEKDSPHDKSSL